MRPVDDRRIEFAGREFRVADRVGLMPLMRFAHLARQGVDASDMDGLTALYDLVRSVIADDDWTAFQEAATTSRATEDELLAVAKQAIALAVDRPSSESSASQDGPSSTSGSSVDDSSSRVIELMERAGRPSVALMVRDAALERASRHSA